MIHLHNFWKKTKNYIKYKNNNNKTIIINNVKNKNKILCNITIHNKKYK